MNYEYIFIMYLYEIHLKLDNLSILRLVEQSTQNKIKKKNYWFISYKIP